METTYKENKTQYKIFVLDDREENLDGARRELGEYGEIAIARNYEEGEKLIQDNYFDLAFIDLNFPRNEKGIEEKLGFEFRDKLLHEKGIPNAIVTGGIRHHDQDAAEVFAEIKAYGVEDIISASLGGNYATPAGVTKENGAWEMAYKRMLERKSVKGYLEFRKLYNITKGGEI